MALVAVVDLSVAALAEAFRLAAARAVVRSVAELAVEFPSAAARRRAVALQLVAAPAVRAVAARAPAVAPRLAAAPALEALVELPAADPAVRVAASCSPDFLSSRRRRAAAAPAFRLRRAGSR